MDINKIEYLYIGVLNELLDLPPPVGIEKLV